MKSEITWQSILLVLLIFVSIASSLALIYGIDVINSNLPDEQRIRNVKFTDLLNPLSDNFFLKILWRASQVSSSFFLVNSILASITLVMLLLILREIVRIIRGA